MPNQFQNSPNDPMAASKKEKNKFLRRFSSKKSARWFKQRSVRVGGGGDEPSAASADSATQVLFLLSYLSFSIILKERKKHIISILIILPYLSV